MRMPSPTTGADPTATMEPGVRFSASKRKPDWIAATRRSWGRRSRREPARRGHRRSLRIPAPLPIWWTEPHEAILDAEGGLLADLDFDAVHSLVEQCQPTQRVKMLIATLSCVAPPGDWVLCPSCDGSNVDRDNRCDECLGDSFVPRFTWDLPGDGMGWGGQT